MFNLCKIKSMKPVDWQRISLINFMKYKNIYKRLIHRFHKYFYISYYQKPV